MPYHLNSSGKVIHVRLLNFITEGDSAQTGATSKTNTAQRGEPHPGALHNTTQSGAKPNPGNTTPHSTTQY